MASMRRRRYPRALYTRDVGRFSSLKESVAPITLHSSTPHPTLLRLRAHTQAHRVLCSIRDQQESKLPFKASSGSLGRQGHRLAFYCTTNRGGLGRAGKNVKWRDFMPPFRRREGTVGKKIQGKCHALQTLYTQQTEGSLPRGNRTLQTARLPTPSQGRLPPSLEALLVFARTTPKPRAATPLPIHLGHRFRHRRCHVYCWPPSTGRRETRCQPRKRSALNRARVDRYSQMACRGREGRYRRTRCEKGES